MLDLREYRPLGRDDFNNDNAWIAYKFQREASRKKIEQLQLQNEQMKKKYQFFDTYRFWCWFYVITGVMRIIVDIWEMLS